ncbi:dipicolinic acid synthetase subunit A [Salipaludibacillus aurantiacus]|uniref:Dipicolinate synthase subunit A n=1 Tax=Salipaludibacillus aurantiacus TaxID=1601833 RepID=A0A1H9QGH1_9BACI|nr:dipicolinic acid synthetase subunit A [Salipaludibacillus aurantiacus]SER59574.1 dipicolinate synthase subunit A [Salipaludibacillus aurantiacus]
MLTGMQIAIIGGDLRQIEVIRKLSKLDASIHLIGYEQLDNGFLGVEKSTFDTVRADKLDALILPVNGISSKREIDSVFAGKQQFFKESWLAETPAHTRIYTGIANKALSEMASHAEKELIELMNRDDLAIYNSIPTAEGALMLVIQNTNVTVHKAKVVITGFGRVGQTIAKTFSQLGADVSVAARETDLLARAYTMGMEPVSLSELGNRAAQADVVINTIPAEVLTAEVIAKMPNHALIVDIASKPGGTNFEFAKKRGIHAILTPGLPGLVAPKTAGIQLANLLSSLLEEQWQEQKGGKR